jgi:hypothetical protein
MKILVIGGKGELGSQIINACQRANYQATASSRNPENDETKFDWADETIFGNLNSFEVIINASPVPNRPLYFRFIQDFLQKKSRFIETTATSAFVSEIIQFQKENSGKTFQGLYVHGAGLFPGLSNVLFSYALSKNKNAKTLYFNIKYSIFSKAGKDMCQLMAESIVTNSTFYKNENWAFDKAIGETKEFKNATIRFENKNEKPEKWLGFLADLPDTKYFVEMAPQFNFIGSYFSPVSGFLFPFLKLFNFAPSGSFFVNIYAKCFFFMRGFLFKNRTSQMQLTVILEDEKYFQIALKDAINAAGVCVAACLAFTQTQKGIKRMDEIVDAESYFEKIKALEPEGFMLNL